jgi:hypothetical protein
VRVVLDTNVFISGVFFTGPPHRILELWRDRRVRLMVSVEILGEFTTHAKGKHCSRGRENAANRGPWICDRRWTSRRRIH